MIFPAWTDLGLLVALCGNVQADGWLERECTFYEVREDEGVVWVGLVWNGDGPSSPGELVQSLTIPVLTDGLAEWDKELSVTLVNPTGGAFLGTNATGSAAVLNSLAATALFAAATSTGSRFATSGTAVKHKRLNP